MCKLEKSLMICLRINNTAIGHVTNQMNIIIQQYKKAKPKTKGYTLIEVLITVAVSSIFVAIAIPSFTPLLQRNSLSTASNDLVGSLALARSEAVKRNQQVTLRAVTADGDTDWNNGFQVVLTNDNTLIKQIDRSNTDVPVAETSMPLITQVTFNGSGTLASTAPNFDFCLENNTMGNTVSVNISGRTRTEAKNDCPTS